jgi:ATP-binding cassette subfamily F protein 3
VSLAVFDHVSLFFGPRCIVADLDLRIADGDRIGLIGPNGSGKSTLLKLLAGDQAADSGKIILRRGARLGYLPQDLAIAGGKPLLEFVLSSVPGRSELDAQLAQVEAELHAAQDGSENRELMEDIAERLGDLHERVGHFDEHFSAHEALRILAGLGFADGDQTRDIGEFSGGWKMRAVLAALLFQQPDLLLLDEPTNHLDMPSVTWFGNFLQRYRRAFVLISHDRDFLNEQIARVVSYEPEGVRQYSGNYERYLTQRAEESEILQNRAKNLEREREENQRFIDRFRAQANKARAVQSRVKRLEKMESVETYDRAQVMRIRFPPSERCSNEVLTGTGLCKAYGARRVLDNLDVRLTRGQRVAIIGPNGAGKTTLLKILAGELTPDAGKLACGHHVKLSYFAQHHADTLHPDSTPFQELSAMDESAGVTRVRTLLGAFLFSGDDVDKKIRVLSGGERARVALARMLMRPGNLLLLDEPTNHLDLASAESLGESLAEYDGTVLFVSHNRSFVKRLATHIWNLEQGRLEAYPGTLDEYMYALRARQDAAERASAQELAPHKAGAATPAPREAEREKRSDEKERKRREAEQRAQRNKVLKPLKDKLAQLESKIEQLERAQKEVTEQLADVVVYADAQRRAGLLAQFQSNKQELDKLTAQWETLTLEVEAKESELAG